MKKIGMLLISLFFVSSVSYISFAGTWQKAGSYDFRYKNNDGSYLSSSWMQDVDGKWYYFNSDGLMVKLAWIDGKYYVGEDGAMLTNSITPDGYRVNSRGECIGKVEEYNMKAECHDILTVFKNGREYTCHILYKKQYKNKESALEIDGFAASKDGEIFAQYHYIFGNTQIRIPVTGYYKDAKLKEGFQYRPFDNQYHLNTKNNTNNAVLLFISGHSPEAYFYIGRPFSGD